MRGSDQALSCRRLWVAVLREALREELEGLAKGRDLRWVGTHHFHRVCDLAGFGAADRIERALRAVADDPAAARALHRRFGAGLEAAVVGEVADLAAQDLCSSVIAARLGVGVSFVDRIKRGEVRP